VAQVVECLPSKYEALSSSISKQTSKAFLFLCHGITLGVLCLDFDFVTYYPTTEQGVSEEINACFWEGSLILTHFLLKAIMKSDVVVYVCNPSTQETEA
jgi:hypothetical protein